MRIIHTADIHLFSRLNSFGADKSRELNIEVLAAFDRLCKYAQECSGAVLICGDLFDRASLSQKEREEVNAVFERYADLGFYILAGNHDKSNLAKMRLPANVRLFGDDWTHYNIGNICIAGKNVVKADDYLRLKLDPQNYNIVMLHGEVSENGFKDGEINIKNYKDLYIDNLALGHYHAYCSKKLDRRGEYTYSGSLTGRGFDETGEKGFCVIDTDNKAVEFVAGGTRVIHNIDIDISSAQNLAQIIALAESKLKRVATNDIVRLTLTGRHKPELIKDTAAIKSFMNFYYSEIVDASRLEINLKDYEHDISLKGEFIRAVQKSDNQNKDKILQLGLAALRGEKL